MPPAPSFLSTRYWPMTLPSIRPNLTQRGHDRPASPGGLQRESRGILDDPLADHGLRRGREPRPQLATAHPTRQGISPRKGECVVGELLVGAVVEDEPHAVAVPSRRQDPQVGVLDVDVRVAGVVEPDDVATVV